MGCGTGAEACFEVEEGWQSYTFHTGITIKVGDGTKAVKEEVFESIGGGVVQRFWLFRGNAWGGEREYRVSV